MHESLRTLKLILKMVHYLPEVQEFFRIYPTKTLVKDQHKLLSERLQQREEGSTRNKLSEVEGLLPYLAMSLDFKVA